MPGVKVRLAGSDQGGGSAIVGVATSQPDGSFTVLGEDDFPFMCWSLTR